MTLKEALPVLNAIDGGAAWQHYSRKGWLDAAASDDPIRVISCQWDIRLKPEAKPEKWAAEKAAFAAGKTIQMKSSINGWVDMEGEIAWNGPEYRVKPEPTYIPLNASDVPPGSALRWTGQHGSWSLITEILDGRVKGASGRYSFSELMEKCEILRPGEAEWKPCRKEKL